MMKAPLLDLVHPDDFDGMRQALHSADETEEPTRFEARFLTAHGEWRILDWSSTVDPSSGLVLSSARDVTTEREALNSLARVNKVVNALVNLQAGYINVGMTADWWQDALDEVVALSESGSGFLGEVSYGDDGSPYLTHFAFSGTEWGPWADKLVGERARDTFEIHNLNSLIGATITNGLRVVSDDPEHDPRAGGVPHGHIHLASFAGIPIRSSDGVVGAIGLANRVGGFDPHLLDELEPLVAALGQVISRDQASRRAAVMSAHNISLTDTFSAVISAETVSAALSEVLHTTNVLAPGAKLDFYVLGKTQGWLDWVEPQRSSASSGSPKPPLRRSDCLALSTGIPHVSRFDSPLVARCPHATAGLTTICNPVRSSGSEFGVLIATYPPAMETSVASEDPATRLLLADALGEVCLRERMESRSLTDSLTGLQNRASFIQAEELHFAIDDRRAKPFGVLILDVDKFKRVNDLFGHQVGDKVLRDIAQAASESVRSEDTLARLGGDEFAAILPNCKTEHLVETAERIRAAVSKVEAPDGVPIKVSVGAALADPGVRWDQVYGDADRALYAAKQGGGSRVEVAPQG